MEEAMKGKVTSFVDSVPEAADCELVIREMAKSGVKVIFTTSSDYMNPIQRVAKNDPDVIFLHAAGDKTAPSGSVCDGRFCEDRYLDGIMAGKMARTNIAGYVGAFPIPEVVMGINAFARGMRSVNPKAEVRVVWVNAWFDPGREREATNALISSGADMITHVTDSATANQVTEEKGAEVISHTSDEIQDAAHAQLMGTVMTWGDYYTQVVKSVMDGTWKPGMTWGGLRMGLIRKAPASPEVPKEVRDLVAKASSQIIAGELHPFAGPVLDQKGHVRVAAGMTLSDQDLGKMDYFVQGVASALPRQ
jgi:simple sugar transport system substrate-binding protein